MFQIKDMKNNAIWSCGSYISIPSLQNYRSNSTDILSLKVKLTD